MYDGLVATVGTVDLSPNLFSIIPDKVDLTLQVRDLNAESMDGFVEKLKREFDEATFTLIHRSEPCLCDPELQALIAKETKEFGLAYEVMPSRASHDAQNFGTVCPVGMVFVPSVNGVSHGKEELTRDHDCISGTEVLFRAVQAFDEG